MTQNGWNSDTLKNAGDGKILIGATGGRPLAANLEVCGFDLTNGTNSITLDTISTGDDYALISSSTASSSSSIDFTGLSSTYHAYVIEITDFAPATDGTILYCRTSTDNGSTWDSGASDYTWNNVGADNDSTVKSGASTGDTKIEILGRTNDPLGGAANETHSLTVYLFNPSSTSYTRIISLGEYIRDNGDTWLMIAGGQRLSAADVDGIRFIMSSGNIASGVFTLYGLKA